MLGTRFDTSLCPACGRVDDLALSFWALSLPQLGTTRTAPSITDNIRAPKFMVEAYRRALNC